MQAVCVRTPPLTFLDGLIVVKHKDALSALPCSYLVAVKCRPNGTAYRALVVNGSIQTEAQYLLELAHSQADAAAVADAKIYAAGIPQYESDIGRMASTELIWANRRVMDLQRLAAGQSDFGEDGWIDVKDWRELLRHFGRNLATGSI